MLGVDFAMVDVCAGPVRLAELEMMLELAQLVLVTVPVSAVLVI